VFFVVDKCLLHDKDQKTALFRGETELAELYALHLGINLCWLMVVGYIKAVKVNGIDNCDMPSACGWLLLMIITKSSQENVKT
jgi:hypothetical protein